MSKERLLKLAAQARYDICMMENDGRAKSRKLNDVRFYAEQKTAWHIYQRMLLEFYDVHYLETLELTDYAREDAMKAWEEEKKFIA